MSDSISQQLDVNRHFLGFALLEMIGVIAIMGILAGAMAPLLLNQLDNSEADAEQVALEAIAEGIRQYYRDEAVATYGALPPNLTALAGVYVGASAADLTSNDRGIARLYVNNGADLTTIPQVTVMSHLLVGGAAPTALAAGCAGNALIAADPCGDSPVTDTDDMPAGIATGLIKVVNLNLAEERSALIQRIQNRYLAPVVSAVEGLSNDVCLSIVDGTYDIDGVDAALNALPIELVNSAPLSVPVGQDLWGNKLQVTKTGNRVVIWSSGPVAMAAVPVNPLYLTANCAPGSDVTEQLNEIANAVTGYAATQNPIVLPAVVGWNATAGLSAAEILDPWGTAITFTTVTGSFTLTSLGPDAGAGGGDDIGLTKSFSELVGLFAAMGRGYDTVAPVSPSGNYANCAAVDAWMAGAGGCDTALGYLINASNCNTAIAYDQECTVAGY